MINFNFDTYLKEYGAMTFDEALELYNGIMAYADEKDRDFRLMWDELVDQACKYVAVRSKWALQTHEERVRADSSRTAQHNAYMATLEPLLRYVKSKGAETDFEKVLGDRGEQRKRWGDFAGYLLLFNTLGNR